MNRGDQRELILNVCCGDGGPPGRGRGEEFKPVRRGWFLGDKEFRRELLELMAERRGERLRAATTVTLRWIAQRLQMGTRHLTHLLYWRRRRK